MTPPVMLFVLAACCSLAPPTVNAQGPPHPRESRSQSDGHYPARGRVIGALPREHVRVVNGVNERYYYSRGAWYAPQGARFVVVAAPIGVFVPGLPYLYTTVWFGGIPYYFANDAYYVWRERARAYEVVERPDETPVPAEARPSDSVFVYPAKGQGPELLAQDRYECHRWASGESGFDPTAPGGGVPADQNTVKRADYQRAFTACLEGRGYSVK